MGTITYFIDGQIDQDIPNGRLGVKYNILNFTLYNAASADVVQALKIGANETILEVDTRVITAEGPTCTASVGDGSGAASWDASVDLNGAANVCTRSAVGTDAYATTGKFYSVADTIDLTMSNAAATAVFEVSALFFVPSKRTA